MLVSLPSAVFEQLDGDACCCVCSQALDSRVEADNHEFTAEVHKAPLRRARERIADFLVHFVAPIFYDGAERRLVLTAQDDAILSGDAPNRNVVDKSAPIMLTCGHAVCRACARGTSEGASVVCSECRSYEIFTTGGTSAYVSGMTGRSALPTRNVSAAVTPAGPVTPVDRHEPPTFAPSKSASTAAQLKAKEKPEQRESEGTRRPAADSRESLTTTSGSSVRSLIPSNPAKVEAKFKEHEARLLAAAVPSGAVQPHATRPAPPQGRSAVAAEILPALRDSAPIPTTLQSEREKRRRESEVSRATVQKQQSPPSEQPLPAPTTAATATTPRASAENRNAAATTLVRSPMTMRNAPAEKLVDPIAPPAPPQPVRHPVDGWKDIDYSIVPTDIVPLRTIHDESREEPKRRAARPDNSMTSEPPSLSTSPVKRNRPAMTTTQQRDDSARVDFSLWLSAQREQTQDIDLVLQELQATEEFLSSAQEEELYRIRSFVDDVLSKRLLMQKAEAESRVRACVQRQIHELQGVYDLLVQRRHDIVSEINAAQAEAERNTGNSAYQFSRPHPQPWEVTIPKPRRPLVRLNTRPATLDGIFSVDELPADELLLFSTGDSAHHSAVSGNDARHPPSRHLVADVSLGGATAVSETTVSTGPLPQPRDSRLTPTAVPQHSSKRPEKFASQLRSYSPGVATAAGPVAFFVPVQTAQARATRSSKNTSAATITTSNDNVRSSSTSFVDIGVGPYDTTVPTLTGASSGSLVHAQSDNRGLSTARSGSISVDGKSGRSISAGRSHSSNRSSRRTDPDGPGHIDGRRPFTHLRPDSKHT